MRPGRFSRIPVVFASMLICYAVLIAVILTACQSQTQRMPVYRIFPHDVVQESVRLVQYSPGSFGVSWTYSHGGAERLAAFWRANLTNEVEYRIGAAKFRYALDPLGGSGPPGASGGWFDNPKETFFFLSESDATNIIAALRTK